jgi:hypothetical protein
LTHSDTALFAATALVGVGGLLWLHRAVAVPVH